MPNWSEILEEVKAAGSTHDVVRRKYLARLHERTGRNVIIYYSAWLQKDTTNPAVLNAAAINDSDKNGFMATIHELKREEGLDLILHTPGGDMATTESLVDYLRAMFGSDIRAFIPQIAMSGGTMIALACDTIVMGKHSNLGPIDPQLGTMPAHGLKEEFERAEKEIRQQGQGAAMLWQPILAKYPPTLIGEARKVIKWSEKMTRQWLETGMFKDETDPAEQKKKIDKVINGLTDSALTLSHRRHISVQEALDLGLRVEALEDDQNLQDDVLAVHHATMQTLGDKNAIKIIENHNGIAHITGLGGGS